MPLCSRHGQRKTLNGMATTYNKLPGCHFDRHNSKQGRKYFLIVYPNQNKSTFTKIHQSAAKTDILAIILHNRINISEPNSETHVSQLPEERSPKICAILLEQGIATHKMLLKLWTPNQNPQPVQASNHSLKYQSNLPKPKTVQLSSKSLKV